MPPSEPVPNPTHSPPPELQQDSKGDRPKPAIQKTLRLTLLISANVVLNIAHKILQLGSTKSHKVGSDRGLRPFREPAAESDLSMSF